MPSSKEKTMLRTNHQQTDEVEGGTGRTITQGKNAEKKVGPMSPKKTLKSGLKATEKWLPIDID